MQSQTRGAYLQSCCQPTSSTCSRSLDQRWAADTDPQPPIFLLLLVEERASAAAPGEGGAAGSERDAAPSAADDGAARLHGRQPRARQHHLPRLRLRLLPPLLGTKGTGLTTYLALLHLPFRPPPLRSLTSGM
jgi:hypothetical protein